MSQIHFSTNWNNKLDCKCFTTIRLAQPKYIPGTNYSIVLSKQGYLGTAKLIAKKTFLLHQLNDWMARIDIGYSREATISIIQKMYPKADWKVQQLDYLLLEWVQRSKPENLTNIEKNP